VAGVTLDAGPLVRLERGDRTMLGWLEIARRRGAVLRVPTAVLAEVWRGGPRSARLHRALAGMDVVDVDRRLAQDAGLLLGAATPDARRLLAVDAIAVACAARRGDLVLTTDRNDIDPLAVAAGVTVQTP